MLDVHTSTIENTELDRSILNTLKASGNAMKSIMINGGIQKVEVCCLFLAIYRNAYMHIHTYIKM
jgi:ribulose kinase